MTIEHQNPQKEDSSAIEPQLTYESWLKSTNNFGDIASNERRNLIIRQGISLFIKTADELIKAHGGPIKFFPTQIPEEYKNVFENIKLISLGHTKYSKDHEYTSLFLQTTDPLASGINEASLTAWHSPLKIVVSNKQSFEMDDAAGRLILRPNLTKLDNIGILKFANWLVEEENKKTSSRPQT